MGEILNFAEDVRHTRRRAHAPPAEGATILFFIGIRYEKWPVESGQKRPKRPSAKQVPRPRKGKRSA